MLEKLKVGIRLDANSKVGQGHFIRCHSLAQGFIKAGYQVIFIVADEESKKKVEDYNYKCYFIDFDMSCLNFTNKTELLSLVEQYSNIMKQTIICLELDILIVDHYQVFPSLLSELRSNIECLVYVDDVNAFDYDVDILINGNLSAKDFDYQHSKHERTLLIGPEFNFMREEFLKNKSKKLEPIIRKIMITTGGSNLYHMIEKLTFFTINNPVIDFEEIHIIIGSGFLDYESFVESLKDNKNVIFHINPLKIWEIMKSVDIAISSGGSTLYELCTSKVPTISFILVDNQIPVLSKLDKLGCVMNLGKYNSFDQSDFNKSLQWMISYENRVQMINKFEGVIDGNGITRVVASIIEQYNKRGGKWKKKQW